MATWDDSDSSEADTESEDERANISLMANISEDIGSSGSESDSEAEEVFSNFSRSQLEESLSEILERYQKLRVINKNLKKNLDSDSEETKNLRLENSELKEKILKHENDLQNTQKETVSEVPSNPDTIIKEYDHNF